MCLSDIVLPWMTQPTGGRFAFTDGGVHELIPADPWRISLQISAVAAVGDVYISPNKSEVDAGIGFGLPVGYNIPALKFLARDDGALCTSNWYGFNVSGNSFMVWAAASVAERYRKMLAEVVEKTLKGGAEDFMKAMLKPNAAFAVPGLIPGVR